MAGQGQHKLGQVQLSPSMSPEDFPDHTSMEVEFDSAVQIECEIPMQDSSMSHLPNVSGDPTVNTQFITAITQYPSMSCDLNIIPITGFPLLCM